jgi:hypothetical protein
MSWLIKLPSPSCQIYEHLSRKDRYQIYTVHDFSWFVSTLSNDSGMLAAITTWHICNRPIQELEFEIDARSVKHVGVVHN